MYGYMEWHHRIACTHILWGELLFYTIRSGLSGDDKFLLHSSYSIAIVLTVYFLHYRFYRSPVPFSSYLLNISKYSCFF